MKRSIIYMVGLCLLLALAGGCRRNKVIPDDKLAQIFKEAYLANDYLTAIDHMPTDSLDIYGSILKKHGYTREDFIYTLGDFSKRKSARISDVVEIAIKDLETEAKYITERVATLDTIDARLGRTYVQQVHFDSIIKARAIRDTAKLHLRIPVEEGKYVVSFNYFVDTLDKNRNLRAVIRMLDSTSRQTNFLSNRLTSDKRQFYTTDIVAKAADDTLEIVFGSYNQKLTAPHLTIDSLVIDYYIPRRAALDSLNKKIIDLNWPTNNEKYTPAQDSSTLYLYPFGIDTTRCNNR